MSFSMIFPIKKINSFDVYRDGGSVSVSFTSYFKRSYVLLFKINDQLINHEIVYDGYKSANLEVYVATYYKSKVTGKKYPKSIKSEKKISWSKARRILRRLSKYQPQLSTDDKESYESMVSFAARDGSSGNS